MATQELQWMALPYDVEKRDGATMLRVAVMCLPKLQDTTTADNTLAEYPDFTDWPLTLQGILIGLNIGGTNIPPTDLTPVDDAPDSDTWKAIFRPTTLVRPFEYKPFTDFRIFSYPVGLVQKTTADLLTSLAKSYVNVEPLVPPMGNNVGGINNDKLSSVGAQDPALQQLSQILLPYIETEKDEVQLRSLKQRWETEGRNATLMMMRQETAPKQQRDVRKGPVEVPSNPETMLERPVSLATPVGQLQMVEIYHTPRNYAVDGVVNGKKLPRVQRVKRSRPKFDFHQVVSVMRDYPVMLRRLGLVRHFEFKMPDGMSANGKIRVNVTFPSPKVGTKNVVPWTAYRLTTSGDAAYWQFLPRPDSDSEIVGPVLCLNDTTNYDVVQIDVDTSAMKTLNFTRAVVGRLKKTMNTRDQKADASPPAVRGTGLQLIRVNRGLKLAKSLIRNANNYNRLVANEEVTLYADDVLRGYRIDVFDAKDNAWRSLMRRNLTLKFPEAATPALRNTGVTVNDEEGVLSFAATRPVSPDPNAMRSLYAHETIAQWENWSLVAPRIGSFIGAEDELQPDQPTQSSPNDFEYRVDSTASIVAKSLPRLRYGRKYRLRARIVDVAGNGPALNELNPLDFTCATELITYLRWDPIVSPTIALRNHPIEGESLERMVIRTFNESDDETVLPPIEAPSLRHVFPPMASVETCERHSMFDDEVSGSMKSDMYDVIVKKTGKAGQPADIPTQWYERSASGGLVPLGAINTTPPVAKQQNAIRYPIAQVDKAVSPYLPDPMSRAVTFQSVPGMNANELLEISMSGVSTAAITSATGVVTVAFDGLANWPDVESILLKLDEGTEKPSWDAGTKTLTIRLPKGEQAWIRFSSSLGTDQTEADTRSALHGHMSTLNKANVTGGALKAAVRGLSWLITPGRTLHLVHATQKPLKKPKVVKGAVKGRWFDSTNARIHLTELYCDARSTQKVDISAHWEMDTDDVSKPAPEKLQQKAHVGDRHAENRTDDTIDFDKTQEFGDTKYRRIEYVPTATTRFREFLPLIRKNTNDKITRLGQGITLDILSSKRPDGVDLLYVVPSFRWVEESKTFANGLVKSTRKGGGLRVYMNRPWYSSGNGELLGVILYSSKKFSTGQNAPPADNGVGGGSGNITFQKGIKDFSKSKVATNVDLALNNRLDIPEQLQPYVTQWGLDPIWLSAPTPADAAPRIQNFRVPDIVLDSVSIEEVPASQRFSVIGYEPKFDAERKLWYCDIEVDPAESYWPFIRLALCRLQPKSVADSQTGRDVYVSRIVQSEFCQLAPDREATARVDDGGATVTVQVVGHTYRMNTAGHQGSDIEVTIERRKPSAGGEDLGWEPVVTQRIDRLHGANMWGGTIPVQGGVNSAQHRVVIKEYEQFFVDPEKNRDSNLGDPVTGEGAMTFSLDKRIVYADILPLF